MADRIIHRRARGNEEGALLVIWTLALVSIILFAALAIDLGNIAQTKQHSQNTSDNAAVSAVADLAPIFTDSSNFATYMAQAVTDAETYVQENDTSVVTADWTDSTKCPGGALPSSVSTPNGTITIYTSSQTNCIGFFNPDSSSAGQTDPTGIAVVEPGRTVNYTLGKVGGLSTQGVSAIAFASIQTAVSNNVLPFGFSASGSKGLQCLKTGSGGNNCTGFTTGSGNFGLICSPRFNLFVAGSCSSGNDPTIDADLTVGLDHVLHCKTSTITPLACTPTVSVVDSSKSVQNGMSTNYCAPYSNADYANPQTGQTDAIVAASLFQGFSGTFLSSASPSCGVPNSGGSPYTFSPRLNHADGDAATATDSLNASPAAVSCYSLSNTSGVPCLATGTFGATVSLNGQHLTNFLLPTSGSSDPKTNPDFVACYNGTKPGGGTPDPAVDPIDEQASGTNVWVTGDLTGASSSCTGGFSTVLANASPTTPIFSSSIEQSPRFGIVPLIDTTGSGPQPIQGFYGVYLDLAFPKNGGGPTPTADSLLAWIFPISLIEDAQLGSSSGFGSFIGGPFVANLCDLAAGNC